MTMQTLQPYAFLRHRALWLSLSLLLLVVDDRATTDAFVVVRRPAAVAAVSSVASPPIRALPVDVDAIRVLSGAAAGSGGEGIDTTIMFDSLRSVALGVAGVVVVASVVLGAVMLVIFSVLFRFKDTYLDRFVEVLRTEYPEKLKELQEKRVEFLSENPEYAEPGPGGELPAEDPADLFLFMSLDDDSDQKILFRVLLDVISGEEDEKEEGNSQR